MSISTSLDIVSVTYNGTSIPVTGGGSALQGKTVSYTPATSSQTDTITADSGYDGLSSVEVTVDAMPSGSASTPATTITATPSLSVNTSTGVVTGSVSASKSVTPVVSAGYVSSGTAGTVTVSGSDTLSLSTQAAKTVTPTTSAQTAVAAGKYTTGAVTVAAMPSGTAGTPSATKGTVSNHAISVTPSVTNTTGYITGGTKTGTAVSVSASELVSGSVSITSNGTVDVTNYASVVVNVPSQSPSLGTKTITANGTYTASDDGYDGYSAVTVNVSSGGITYDEIASRSAPSGDITLSVTSVGDYAFAYRTNSNQWTVYAPNVTYLGQNTFRGCTYLTSARFPSLLSQHATGYAFYGNTRLQVVDWGLCDVKGNTFVNCRAFTVLILRKTTAIQPCANMNVFKNTPFNSGGTGGTIYIPQVLYDQLGTGSSLDYKAATNWSTYDSYGTITWAVLEGSIYE